MPSLNARPLILASSSPYRRQLLERLQLPFTCCAPDIAETALPGETPRDTALRLALAKARAVARTIAEPQPSALIIGSDQIADLDGQPLGKPGDHARATAQLRAMRGKAVVFHTALCLLDAASGRHQLENVPTTVHMRESTDKQIENYLRMDRPYDCAGSAKIESLGVTLVHKTESDDPTALIGLPLMTLITMLANAGIELP